MSAERRDVRAGLRDLDRHASWREVYWQLDVDPDQIHKGVGDGPT